MADCSRMDGLNLIPERTTDCFAHCAGDRLPSYPKRLGHLHFVARPLIKVDLLEKNMSLKSHRLFVFKR